MGEEEYTYRIIEALAVTNTIYAQSNIKQVHLLAIIVSDREMSRTDSPGNALHSLERIRKYTVLPDGADTSIVMSGVEFTMPNLWGWAEGLYACELQRAVAEGTNINTHKVGQAAAAVIDLPTLIRRGWIMAHEIAHTLGAGHNADDPLTDGFYQPQLALKDYVAGCAARSSMVETCAFDAQRNRFTGYYTCP